MERLDSIYCSQAENNFHLNSARMQLSRFSVAFFGNFYEGSSCDMKAYDNDIIECGDKIFCRKCFLFLKKSGGGGSSIRSSGSKGRLRRDNNNRNSFLSKFTTTLWWRWYSKYLEISIHVLLDPSAEGYLENFQFTIIFKWLQKTLSWGQSLKVVIKVWSDNREGFPWDFVDSTGLSVPSSTPAQGSCQLRMEYTIKLAPIQAQLFKLKS